MDDSTTSNLYDMIIGTDLMTELGITINFAEQVMMWDGATAPLKDCDCIFDIDILHLIYEEAHYSETLFTMSKQQTRILDADYHSADLTEVSKAVTHLDVDEQQRLYYLLKQYEYLFNGTLEKWKGKPVDFELKPNAKPYHEKAYPIPQCLELTTCKECKHLCKLGVLCHVNHSEWVVPTFIKSKKNNSVHFLSDFRELNK